MDLKASKEAQGKMIYSQLKTKADNILTKYKAELISIFKENAELEIDVKQRALRNKFYKFMYKLASLEVLTVRSAPAESKWKCCLTNRELAGNTVTETLSTGLKSDPFMHLGSERANCTNEFKERYFKRGIEPANDEGEIKDASIVKKASSILTIIMSNCVFELFDYLDRKEKNARLEADMKILLEDEDQWQANADVKEILGQIEDCPMEESS